LVKNRDSRSQDILLLNYRKNMGSILEKWNFFLLFFSKAKEACGYNLSIYVFLKSWQEL
jgi:hypothetical protein